jgi:hypothetical protein
MLTADQIATFDIETVAANESDAPFKWNIQVILHASAVLMIALLLSMIIIMATLGAPMR